MKKYIATLFLLLFVSGIFAQTQLSDSAKVSILTASPWSGAAYALYGHTAVLVQDDSTGVDAVFNYGFFDLTKPYFMYNFMRGRTDYILGVNTLEQFLAEYKIKGSEVVEQELNLSQSEKQNLWKALYINALPENRGYRYNYFFDNCVTRPRDLTEKYVEGKIQYPADTKKQTFRDLIHECVSPYPWMKFGIDLVIGGDADKPIGLREKMFLPAYLMHAFEDASVAKPDTIPLPLVKNTNIILNAVKKGNKMGEHGLSSPFIIAFALIVFSILVSFIQMAKLNKTFIPKIYDTVLFCIAGVAGCIIFFLMFFSVHPATNPNWNLVWLNPIALIFGILFWVKSARKGVFVYHFINFAILTLFLLLWWLIPQQFSFASILFSVSLWIRSGANVFIQRKRKLRNRHFVSSRYMKAGWGQ